MGRPIKLGDYWSFSDTAYADAHGNLMPVARMAPNFRYGPGKVPAKAAYWKKIMDLDNVQQRRIWIEFLDQRGFSYRFNSAKTELYFSNARNEDFTFLSGQGEIIDVEDEDDLIESFKALNGIVDVESDDEGSSTGNGDSDKYNSQ